MIRGISLDREPGQAYALDRYDVSAWDGKIPRVFYRQNMEDISLTGEVDNTTSYFEKIGTVDEATIYHERMGFGPGPVYAALKDGTLDVYEADLPRPEFPAWLMAAITKLKGWAK